MKVGPLAILFYPLCYHSEKCLNTLAEKLILQSIKLGLSPAPGFRLEHLAKYRVRNPESQ